MAAQLFFCCLSADEAAKSEDQQDEDKEDDERPVASPNATGRTNSCHVTDPLS